MELNRQKCWIFGDESGYMGKDRFFAIGIIGTRQPKELIAKLREIRIKTDYFDEISYKSPNQKRILCAIRWMDWFFSGQTIAHFRILLKDSTEFDVQYYDGNKYNATAKDLAYCQSYKEVMNNFACYGEDEKNLVYNRIGLEKVKIEEHLTGKITGFAKERCFSKDAKERKKDDSMFTGCAEILQLCDLLTSSTRGLCCSLFGEEISEKWDKNTLRKNVHYYLPNIKEKILENKNLYYPSFKPFERQIFTLYKWRGGVKRQNAPI